jgi:hypothetical protein
MKQTITFEGDFYEDREEMKIILHSSDMYSSLWDARNKIRNRTKYENITEQEEKFLEELSEILYIEGLD